MTERQRIELDNDIQALRLYGPGDQWLQLLRDGLDVEVVARGLHIYLTGEDIEVQKARDVLAYLSELALVRELTPTDIIYGIEMTDGEIKEEVLQGFKQVLLKNIRGESIRIRTLGQKKYVKAIEEKTITFGIGPAGTG